MVLGARGCQIRLYKQECCQRAVVPCSSSSLGFDTRRGRWSGKVWEGFKGELGIWIWQLRRAGRVVSVLFHCCEARKRHGERGGFGSRFKFCGEIEMSLLFVGVNLVRDKPNAPALRRRVTFSRQRSWPNFCAINLESNGASDLGECSNKDPNQSFITCHGI